MVTKIIIVAILIFSIVIPFGGFLLGKKKEGSFKAALGLNLLLFFGTVVVADMLLFSGNIQAADITANIVSNTAGNGDSTTGVAATASNTDGWRYLAAALSTGLSCIGAGVAVASAASAAIGALSEDSSIMGKALIFVALAESIALYGLLISFSILG